MEGIALSPNEIKNYYEHFFDKQFTELTLTEAFKVLTSEIGVPTLIERQKQLKIQQIEKRKVVK